MTFLLDVNLLIALIDPTHVHADLAHDWFEAEGRHGFATCPIVENGVIRIVGNPNYRNSPGTTGLVIEALRAIRALPGHVFWPDTISMLDGLRIDANQLSSGRVTDTYLLALAVANAGRLASLDRKLSTAAVSGGGAALRLINA